MRIDWVVLQIIRKQKQLEIKNKKKQSLRGKGDWERDVDGISSATAGEDAWWWC